MDIIKTRSDITDVIETVARAQGLKHHKITDVQANSKGEGYLGEILMVKVKDELIDKELNLIVKSAFQDNNLRDFVPIRMAFENEGFFYSTIYSTFKKFEKEKGVTRSELVPKCYEVSLNDESEILVLENLKTSGFQCFEKTEVLDDDHVKMIFEAYGRYHAYSYAYKDQHPEEFEQMASKTQHVFQKMLERDAMHSHMKAIIKLIKEFLVPGEDDEILRRFGKYDEENVVNTFLEAATMTCDHSVIVHGDCWSNNMLFKYETIDGSKKPVDIRLIDWQLIKLGSPACDLSYFLYSGASKKVFDKLDYYLEIYHNSLSSLVKELGTNPEKMFTFENLKEHWKIYAKYGIIMAFQIIRMKLTYQDEILDLKDLSDDFNEESGDEFSSKFLGSAYNKELFVERIKDLLNHLCEIDVL